MEARDAAAAGLSRLGPFPRTDLNSSYFARSKSSAFLAERRLLPRVDDASRTAGGFTLLAAESCWKAPIRSVKGTREISSSVRLPRISGASRSRTCASFWPASMLGLASSTIAALIGSFFSAEECDIQVAAPATGAVRPRQNRARSKTGKVSCSY